MPVWLAYVLAAYGGSLAWRTWGPGSKCAYVRVKAGKVQHVRIKLGGVAVMVAPVGSRPLPAAKAITLPDGTTTMTGAIAGTVVNGAGVVPSPAYTPLKEILSKKTLADFTASFLGSKVSNANVVEVQWLDASGAPQTASVVIDVTK